MADQSYVENLLLFLGVDDKSRAGWLSLEKAARSTGDTFINILDKHEQLSQVSQTFSESATRSFSNTGQLVEKFSGRVASLSKNFNIVNVGVQAAGASIDLLNFKWEESLNMMDRWSGLASNSLVKTLTATYIGYKALSSAVSFSAEVFYKSGQAMADQVKMQERMAETNARLTGSVENLTHRSVKLAEIRVYREMGKDLSQLGQMWAATERAGASFSSWLAKQATSGASWVASWGAVEDILWGVTEAGNALTKAFVGDIATEAAQATFRAKSFKTIADATKHASENMQSWSAETGIAGEEIAGVLEQISRRTGNIAGAYSLMTVAMEKSFKTQHVNAREMVALMSALATGAEVDTEAMRVFNAELDTSGVKFLNAGERVKYLIDQMLSGRDAAEKADFFDNLRKSATAAYGLMTTTLDNYSARELDLTADIRKEFESLSTIKRRGHEEEVAYLQVINKFLDQQSAQYDRQIRAAQARAEVNTSFAAGGDTSSYYAAQLQQLAKLQDAEKTLRQTSAAGAQRQLQENLNQQMSAHSTFFTELEANIKRNASAIADSLRTATELRFSVSSSDISNVKELGKELVKAYEDSYRLNSANLDKTMAAVERAKSDEVNLGQVAARAVQEFSTLRSGLVSDMSGATARVNEIRSTILDTYSYESDLMQGNFQQRMQQFDVEMRMLEDIKRASVGSIEAQTDATLKQFALMKSKQEELLKYQQEQRGAVDIMNRSPGEKARQSAYDKYLPEILKFIEKGSGELSPKYLKIMEGMSTGSKELIQNMQAVRQVNTGKAAANDAVVTEAIAKSGGSAAEALRMITSKLGNNTDAITYAVRRLSEAGNVGRVMQPGGIKSNQDEIAALRQQLKELAATYEAQVIASNAARVELDKKWASEVEGLSNKLKTPPKDMEAAYAAATDAMVALRTKVEELEKTISDLPLNDLSTLPATIADAIKKTLLSGTLSNADNSQSPKDKLVNLTPSDEENRVAAAYVTTAVDKLKERLDDIAGRNATDAQKRKAVSTTMKNFRDEFGDLDSVAAKAAGGGMAVTDEFKAAINNALFDTQERLRDKVLERSTNAADFDKLTHGMVSDETKKASMELIAQENKTYSTIAGNISQVVRSQLEKVTFGSGRAEADDPRTGYRGVADATAKVAERQVELLQALLNVVEGSVPALKNLKVPPPAKPGFDALTHEIKKFMNR